MLKAKTFKEYQNIQIDNIDLLLEIHHEWRMSARVSLTKNKAIIRIPIMSPSFEKTKHILWAKEWIYKRLTKDHLYRAKYLPKVYETGSQLTVRNSLFTLDVKENIERKTATGRRRGYVIYLELPANITVEQRQKMCSSLISNIMSKTYIEGLRNRVHELNKQFFNKEINQIRLRNNHSNWGSCSTNKNISISSRLLLAPNVVLDYIIIHELAHLVHHNHSAKFWAEVERAMPNYLESEKWLKDHGESCQW